MASITGNVIYANNLNPSSATLLVVDVNGGVGLGQTYRADGSVAAQPLGSRTINFNSTQVGADEAAAIAQAVGWCCATGSSKTFTFPVSGLTVVGNGMNNNVSLGATVATISLNLAQAQAFAEAVGQWAATCK
jgi:hypothetical protein